MDMAKYSSCFKRQRRLKVVERSAGQTQSIIAYPDRPGTTRGG